MKSLMVVAAVSLTMCQANAQKIKRNEVPAIVKNALQANYNVTDADWDKEGESFEANFKQKGKEVSVVLDSQGNILETEIEIGKNELPQMVRNTLKHDFADYKIEETARIESKGEITYEVEVEKGEQTFDLIFDVNGKLLKKLIIEDDEN